MNKEEFLNQLEKLLSDIPEEERYDALEYYRDFFEDATKDEKEIIEELGSPSIVAENIRKEIFGDGSESTVKHQIEKYEGPDKNDNYNNPFHDKYEFDSKQIKNIDATINAGTLIIKESYTDNIVVEVSKNDSSRRRIEVKQKFDTLKIDEHSLYFQLNVFRKNLTEITVYLPSDIQLEDVKLDVAAGKVEIEKLSVRNMLNVDVSAGNVNIEELSVHNMLKADVNAGDINLNNVQANFIDADCNAGNIYMNINSLNKMKLDCQVGNIRGNINENIYKFNYNIDSNMGTVSINDRKLKGYYGHNNAKNTIEADCNMGSIKLYLEQ